MSYLTKAQSKDVMCLLYSMFESYSGGYTLDNFIKDYTNNPDHDLGDEDCYEKANQILDIKKIFEKKPPKKNLKVELGELNCKLKQQKKTFDDMNTKNISCIVDLNTKNCKLEKEKLEIMKQNEELKLQISKLEVEKGFIKQVTSEQKKRMETINELEEDVATLKIGLAILQDDKKRYQTRVSALMKDVGKMMSDL